jgi:hypothetical protein
MDLKLAIGWRLLAFVIDLLLLRVHPAYQDALAASLASVSDRGLIRRRVLCGPPAVRPYDLCPSKRIVDACILQT